MTRDDTEERVLGSFDPETRTIRIASHLADDERDGDADGGDGTEDDPTTHDA